jgi:hypothetical protein
VPTGWAISCCVATGLSPYLWTPRKLSGIVGHVTAWLPALSALLGALIGAGSALLSQRYQWRQQVSLQDRNTRRELYGAYLTALHEAGENLWQISSGVLEPSNGDFRRPAHDAFQAGALYSLRAQIIVLAPSQVVDATHDALRAMRHMRDCVAQGYLIGSEEHDAAERVVHDSNRRLRETMREDLGTVDGVNAVLTVGRLPD